MVLLRVILTVSKPLSDRCMVALVLTYLHVVSYSLLKRSLSNTLRIHLPIPTTALLFLQEQHNNIISLPFIPLQKSYPQLTLPFKYLFLLPPPIFYSPLVPPSTSDHQNCTRAQLPCYSTTALCCTLVNIPLFVPAKEIESRALTETSPGFP